MPCAPKGGIAQQEHAAVLKPTRDALRESIDGTPDDLDVSRLVGRVPIDELENFGIGKHDLGIITGR